MNRILILLLSLQVSGSTLSTIYSNLKIKSWDEKNVVMTKGNGKKLKVPRDLFKGIKLDENSLYEITFIDDRPIEVCEMSKCITRDFGEYKN